MNAPRPDPPPYLYLLAFTEGGAVMAAELLGAKITAPFFGNSLYVWAAVLGVTLAALMTGYFLGGRLSHRWPVHGGGLFWILGAAGLAVMVMPATGPWMMARLLALPVQWGTTLALLAFLFPPLCLLGTVSPLIIRRLARTTEHSGRTAGTVYAVSTLGGILATFAVGFYLMPEWGIRRPAWLFGTTLVVLPLWGLLRRGRAAALLWLLLPVTVLAWLERPGAVPTGAWRVVHEAEGILGQLRVVDYRILGRDRRPHPVRALLVNNTGQTLMDLADPRYSAWPGAAYFPAAASIYPAGSRVLLLGLGGGTLVKQFQRLGFRLQVVELDRRVVEVAHRYFYVDPAVPVEVDDARHYLNTARGRYQLIVLDLFLNETPPAHVMTLEAFRHMERLLAPAGMIMINFYGFIHGPEGLAARALYRTLLSAGLQVRLLATPGSEAARNLIFLAGRSLPDFSRIRYRLRDGTVLADLPAHFIQPPPETAAAPVLRDVRPVLEKLYLPAALAWRRGSNLRYTRRLLEAGVPPLH